MSDIPLILLMSGLLYATVPKIYSKYTRNKYDTNSTYFPDFKDPDTNELKKIFKKVESMIKKEDKVYLNDIKGNVKQWTSLNPGFDSYNDVMSDDKAKELSTFVEKPYKGIKGIVLHGPPGTGKTDTAKLICKNRKMYMITIKDDILAGRPFESVSRLNVIKILAEELKPCMIFMDEMDGIFKSRTYTSDAAANVASASATNFVLNMINDMNNNIKKLTSDKINTNDDIFIVGATNHLDRVDGALLDRLVLKIYMDKKPDVKKMIKNMLGDDSELLKYITNTAVPYEPNDAWVNIIAKNYKNSAGAYNLLDDHEYMINFCNKSGSTFMENYSKYNYHANFGTKSDEIFFRNFFLKSFETRFKVELLSKLNKTPDDTHFKLIDLLEYLVSNKKIYGRDLENRLNMLNMYFDKNGSNSEVNEIIKNGKFFGKRRKSKKNKRSNKRSKRKSKKNKRSRRKSKKRINIL